MSEINANIVVEPIDLTISTNNNQIVVTPTALNLNVFTNDSAPGGFSGDLQYNANGLLGGIPTANYVNGNLKLGSSSNLKITGGANAYFLQTDGTGNLTWAPGTVAPSGNGTSAGANNQIQLSDGAGNFKAAPGFTFDPSSNLFTAPGDAYIAGNMVANGNVQGTYLLGNGYYITGIDPSQISNGSTNVKVYANTITFSENGNANVVTIGPNQQMTVTTMNVNSLANFFGAVGFNAPVTIGSNLTVSGNLIVADIINAIPIGLSAPSFTFDGNATNSLVTTNVNVTGNITATGTFIGNGYTLTSINGSNITGIVPSANVANTVVNGFQPNITSLGNLTTLTINSGNSNNFNTTFVPIGAGLNTAIGLFSYVQIANLGTTGNTTNTAVVIGDRGTNNFAIRNDVFANIGGNLLSVASQGYNLTGGNTTDKAAPSLLSWSIFDTNSDIANANTATGTSLQVGAGIAVTRGAPIDNSGVIGTFSYGGNATPSDSTGLRMTRRRGNGAVRLSLQPNDYIANIEWRGGQANGALPTGNRFAKIGAKVDSTYVANTAAQPVGLEFVVVNSTANITHSFYSNGEVNFANNVTASNVTANYFIGNGSQLTGLPDVTGIANGSANVRAFLNANVSISAGGNANILVATGTGINIAGTLNATGVITGNGSGLSALTGANVTGTVANATYATNAGNATTANTATTAGTVTTAAQPNITSVGTLSSLTVTGNTTSNNFIGRLANGNSNIAVQNNGNILLSASGAANVLVIYSGGIEVGSGKSCNILGTANINTLIANTFNINSFTTDNLNVTGNRIHLGNGAGGFGANMANDSIVIGNLAGRGANCLESVYIGYNAGSNNASTRSIGIGYQAALTNQGQRAIAIGGFAGSGTQGANSIAVGYFAGQTGQLGNAIAIGSNAGQSAQQSSAIALGQLAGQQGQGTYSIAIGTNAGANNQSANAIAIGTNAGYPNTQANNSIVLNASGANLDAPTANALFVKPIRNVTGDPGFTVALYYNPTTGEIGYK